MVHSILTNYVDDIAAVINFNVSFEERRLRARADAFFLANTSDKNVSADAHAEGVK